MHPPPLLHATASFQGKALRRAKVDYRTDCGESRAAYPFRLVTVTMKAQVWCVHLTVLCYLLHASILQVSVYIPSCF